MGIVLMFIIGNILFVVNHKVIKHFLVFWSAKKASMIFGIMFRPKLRCQDCMFLIRVAEVSAVAFPIMVSFCLSTVVHTIIRSLIMPALALKQDLLTH